MKGWEWGWGALARQRRFLESESGRNGTAVSTQAQRRHSLCAEQARGCAAPDLDGAVGGDQLVLEVPRPEAGASQVREEVLIHHRELPRQHPPHVDVAGVRLEALVVAQNLHAARGESAQSVDT